MMNTNDQMYKAEHAHTLVISTRKSCMVCFSTCSPQTVLQYSTVRLQYWGGMSCELTN